MISRAYTHFACLIVIEVAPTVITATQVHHSALIS